MSKPKIFIACDTRNPKTINKIIKQCKNNKLKVSYKIGLEFFLSKKGRIYYHNWPFRLWKNYDAFYDCRLE